MHAGRFFLGKWRSIERSMSVFDSLHDHYIIQPEDWFARQPDNSWGVFRFPRVLSYWHTDSKLPDGQSQRFDRRLNSQNSLWQQFSYIYIYVAVIILTGLYLPFLDRLGRSLCSYFVGVLNARRALAEGGFESCRTFRNGVLPRKTFWNCNFTRHVLKPTEAETPTT